MDRRRTRLSALAVAGLAGFLVTAMTPSPAAAPNVCDGAFQITYPAGANFPQPVPPCNTGDDQLTVQLDLGAGAIVGGANNQLTVNDVRFDLDCSDAFPAPGCTDQGDIMEYLGDGTITTNCAGVTWTSSVISTNQLRFTPSSPIVIPAGTPIQCSLSFAVKVANLPANSPPSTKEV